MTDLSQSFNKLIDSMYENIGGCLCEKLPNDKFRWREFIGTREEVEAKINEAKTNIQNSLNKST